MARLRVTRKQFVIALLLFLSLMDHLGAFGHHPESNERYDGATARVTYVADGDTFDIDIPDGQRPVTRIRLWGVDCPEISHSPDEVDAHFGREAADFVQEHLTGRNVRLWLDPNRLPRDKYGRLLAYVELADSGELLNELLVEEGLAYADRRFPHVYKQRFVSVEQRAMRAKHGLWEHVTPMMMPSWRQRMDAAGVR